MFFKDCQNTNTQSKIGKQDNKAKFWAMTERTGTNLAWCGRIAGGNSEIGFWPDLTLIDSYSFYSTYKILAYVLGPAHMHAHA